MDKFDILRNYANNRIRDSWQNLGGQIITSATRLYTKDLIYQVNFPTSILHGALIFCTESYQSSDALPWQSVEIESTTYGYFSFVNRIISQNFKLLLSAEELAAVTDPVDPNFVPYTEANTSNLVIDDAELNIIACEALGVPFLNWEDLEFTKQEIIDNMIRPALDEYLKFFPLIELQSELAYANFKIQLPTDCFGVIRVAVIQDRGVAPNGVANPLTRYFDEFMWWGMSGGGNSSTMRPLYNYRAPQGFRNLQGFAGLAFDRVARQGQVNFLKRQNYKIVKDPVTGLQYLQGWTNLTGTLEIAWAKKTNRWSNIDYEHLLEVREMARAKILRSFGTLRMMVRSDIPGQIDWQNMITRADAIENKVIQDWKDHTKVVIIRG